ncbi:hypothetical protein GCM10023115_36480 [Pontixanthobacter gangjinensis]|uniref:Lipoprotein n=1 Tax=Christiangramia aestuarii TaxID=1028746 RepID=A0A7K1LQU8_9FLAO|nr:hypothetical protein [Christiangramia aestuarii]MUP43185.1 hypothetical protein [Christiangramia aestuarii]
MRKIILIAAVILMAACNSAKKGTSGSTSKYSVENLGKMNIQELQQNYPDSNMEEGVDLYEEGTEERAFTILYPGTSDEMHITWQDRDRTKIHDLRFSEDGKWTSETGIDIGTSYEELNRLNGKKISFYGFGWDYSGAVDWNGGKLEKSGLRVFLTPTKDAPGKFYGDKLIKASPEEIEALDLKVASIMINYAI